MSSAVAECIVTIEGEENVTSIAGSIHIFIYTFLSPPYYL